MPVELAGWIIRQFHDPQQPVAWVMHLSADEDVKLAAALLGRMPSPVSVVTCLTHKTWDKETKGMLDTLLASKAIPRYLHNK